MKGSTVSDTHKSAKIAIKLGAAEGKCGNCGQTVEDVYKCIPCGVIFCKECPGLILEGGKNKVRCAVCKTTLTIRPS